MVDKDMKHEVKWEYCFSYTSQQLNIIFMYLPGSYQIKILIKTKYFTILTSVFYYNICRVFVFTNTTKFFFLNLK